MIYGNDRRIQQFNKDCEEILGNEINQFGKKFQEKKTGVIDQLVQFYSTDNNLISDLNEADALVLDKALRLFSEINRLTYYLSINLQIINHLVVKLEIHGEAF
jgi:hypothetical protein